MVIDKTDKILSDFQNEIAEGKTAIKFFATWCGPCKMVGLVYDEISKEEEGMNFFEVDIDKNPELTAAFGVKALPTIILVENGEKIKENVGYLPKNKLKDFLVKN